MPRARDLLWPTLRAIDGLGGSASVPEITEKVLALEHFTDEQLGFMHGNGPKTEIEYRLAWARTYLKLIGALTNSAYGVWSLIEKGRTLTEADMGAVPAQVRAAIRSRSRLQHDEEEIEAEGSDESDWREALLKVLLDLAPNRFERLAQRLLREAGFISVVITGRSGDGGIDGVGVYKMSLVSFPVFFQCKRFRGSVGPGAVRDFRGAMSGRGDKGLLITTASFTSDARREATRDGAPPVDLIDGDQLCDLLKEHGLGVSTKTRQVEEVSIVGSYFDEL